MHFGQIGLIVDSVTSVMSVDQAKVEPVPPGSSSSEKSFVTSIYSDGNQMTLFLDIDQIFGNEAQRLNSRNSTQVA